MRKLGGSLWQWEERRFIYIAQIGKLHSVFITIDLCNTVVGLKII